MHGAGVCNEAGSSDEHSFQFLTAMPQHYLTVLLSCLENAAGVFVHSFACKGCRTVS